MVKPIRKKSIEQIGYVMKGLGIKRKSRNANVPATSQIPKVVLMQSLCIIILAAKVRIKREKAKKTIL